MKDKDTQNLWEAYQDQFDENVYHPKNIQRMERQLQDAINKRDIKRAKEIQLVLKHFKKFGKHNQQKELVQAGTDGSTSDLTPREKIKLAKMANKLAGEPAPDKPKSTHEHPKLTPREKIKFAQAAGKLGGEPVTEDQADNQPVSYDFTNVNRKGRRYPILATTGDSTAKLDMVGLNSKGEEVEDYVVEIEWTFYGDYYPQTLESPAEEPEAEDVTVIEVLGYPEDGGEVDLSGDEKLVGAMQDVIRGELEGATVSLLTSYGYDMPEPDYDPYDYHDRDDDPAWDYIN